MLLALLYGTGRFAFDFFRDDLRRLGLTGSQWTALALVTIATVLLARRRALGPSLAVAVDRGPSPGELTDVAGAASD